MRNTSLPYGTAHIELIDFIKEAHGKLVIPTRLSAQPLAITDAVCHELTTMESLSNKAGLVKAISAVVNEQISAEMWQWLLHHPTLIPANQDTRKIREENVLRVISHSSNVVKFAQEAKVWALDPPHRKSQVFWVKLLSLFPLKRLYFRALLVNNAELIAALFELRYLIFISPAFITYSQHPDNVERVASALYRIKALVTPDLFDNKWCAPTYLVEQLSKSNLSESDVAQLLNLAHSLSQKSCTGTHNTLG